MDIILGDDLNAERRFVIYCSFGTCLCGALWRLWACGLVGLWGPVVTAVDFGFLLWCTFFNLSFSVMATLGRNAFLICGVAVAR